MTAKAIDPLGVTVIYPQATRWYVNAIENTIRIYSGDELIAEVPGDWLVRIEPATELDPGVATRV